MVASSETEKAGVSGYRPLIEGEERSQPTVQPDSAIVGPPTPLPWRQLPVLLLLNAMQPLVYRVIFPFVNQMILEIGVVDDPERVGYYSGLIESIFSCMSFIAILPCSALADRVGRKPVILVGMLGLAASTACFGMGKSYLAIILSRCLGGTLGGVGACIRMMIGEMTDKSNQVAAFSANMMAFNIGQIVGFPIGGMFAHPERTFPLFRTHFWYMYPFALPCFVAAALCLCTVAWGCFSLPETLRLKQRKSAKGTGYGTIDPTSNLESSSGAPHIDETSKSTLKNTYKAVLTRSIISLLCSNLMIGLSSNALFSIFPLFAFTPVSSGGLGMSEAAIGTQMGVRSILSVSTMGLFPSLQRHFGSVRVYQLTMWATPVTILFFPLLNFLARRGAGDDFIFTITFSIFLIMWSGTVLSLTAIAVLVTDHAPSADSLATINGLSQMSMVLPQAIAPVFVTSLFAASIKSGIAGGNLVWIVLVLMTVAGAIHSMTLRESETDWRKT